MMIPDIPGRYGNRSTSQTYINDLFKSQLDVAGIHFHWTGGSVYKNDHLVTAVHHQTTSCLNPMEFSSHTIEALMRVDEIINKRKE